MKTVEETAELLIGACTLSPGVTVDKPLVFDLLNLLIDERFDEAAARLEVILVDYPELWEKVSAEIDSLKIEP